MTVADDLGILDPVDAVLLGVYLCGDRVSPRELNNVLARLQREGFPVPFRFRNVEVRS